MKVEGLEVRDRERQGKITLCVWEPNGFGVPVGFFVLEETPALDACS